MGYSKREMQEREASIIDFAEIGEFIDAPVKQYSTRHSMAVLPAVAHRGQP